MSKPKHPYGKNFILLAVSLLTLLAACQPAQPATTVPDVGTIVAQTLEALTAATSTPVPANGLPVSYHNTSFIIPLELNASVTPSTGTDVEFPYINPSLGPMPEHSVFSFTNYPLPRGGRIMIFKASEYAAYSQLLQETITALLAGQDTLQPLPDALIHGHFYAQAKAVNFKNGHGVRYLIQNLDSLVPITNEGLFYCYQGITTDGAYFVSATFGVNAGFLVADGNPASVTPPDGVPFGNGTDFDYSAYLSAVTQKLNDTPAESYVPSLLTLDRMIESLQISVP